MKFLRCHLEYDHQKMNAGIVASRYAKALLKFVQETGNGDKTYAQAVILVLRMEEINQLEDYICNHCEISLEKKLQLLETSLGEPMTLELNRFTALVFKQRRMEFFLRMLQSFLTLYREANHIRLGRIITALPADGLKERLETLFRERTGMEVHLDMEVNPEILGGFIFELDDLRLDASVVSQFREIKRKLIEQNNRIV